MSAIDPAAAPAQIPTASASDSPVALATGAGAEIYLPRGPVRRVAALGIGVGLLGTALSAGIPLLTDSIAQAFFNLDRTPILSLLIVALPTVTVGLYMLLLFYGIRLALTERRPGAEASRYVRELRKFRGVCAPLLACQLLVVTLGQTEGLPLSAPFTIIGLLCSVGCCYTLLDSRRVAWEVALAQGAVFTPEHDIGFQVLTPGTPAGGRGPIPVLSVAPAEATFPTAGRATVPLATTDRSDFADWERILYVLVLLIIILFLLEVPDFLRHAGEYFSPSSWSRAWDRATARVAAPGGRPRSVVGARYSAPPPASATGTDLWLEFFLQVGAAASGVVALAWVVWGVFCLAVGPRARRGVLRFASAAIALALVIGGLRIYGLESAADRIYNTTGLTRSRFQGMQYWSTAGPMLGGSPGEQWAQDARLELFRQGVTETGLPLLLMFVLTRDPVKALFVRRPRKRG